MLRTQRMELLSKAYVRAVVAHAGGICVEPTPDYGIDFSIHGVAREPSQFCDEAVTLDLQLKSTTATDYFPSDDAYHYKLDVKAYNYLRKESILVPRFLVLFVMPRDEELWLNQDNEGLLLRNCAYYASLRGSPQTANEHAITVLIPRTQVFSVDFLHQQFRWREIP